ncbi:50S ribosomal protein L20 [Candidatus Peregrinibacteria bacterium]|jgi:large subunit ribosomal protein L20|nr:50S ribosomal protein L20 [Candidatus Peregrinibacteria bacterium]MBT4148038.1 50S ribosomal protein L20 [Candidatus Peregrinibacteria bacterium]MBT4366058.1 50S ribosomal protein L20 [Candidatus Peregrinibacteria bacterium]MBT4455561.1 50S ribosomal protein L20 [Candidatus Peregrinibacteria bacterium]
MTRVKRGVTTHRRHQKTLKAAKGYRGHRSKLFRAAKNAVTKAGQNAYRDRKLKKRTFRTLWIARINAACRAHGSKYSALIDGCFKKDIRINRKMLAELAANNPDTFKAVLDEALK